jgi:hypothetical protein
MAVDLAGAAATLGAVVPVGPQHRVLGMADTAAALPGLGR